MQLCDARGRAANETGRALREEVVDEEKAEQDAIRMLKGKFDMNDFLEQIGVLQKMGSLKDMVAMIPGVSEAIPENAQIDDNELVKIKAIISSMTEDERTRPDALVVSNHIPLGPLDLGKDDATSVGDLDHACRSG